ncbi:MAG: polyphenol oxidase family protein [Actinomycetota bacterium]|nr:polyphenol oxidase family protein [Actinomycetota bacterium]
MTGPPFLFAGSVVDDVVVSTDLTETKHDGVRLLTASTDHARVAFTDRDGGVSRAPYDSLNLAIRVGDNRADVIENRRRAARAAGFDPQSLVLGRQVHGTGVIEARRGDAGVVGEADILVARNPGTTLGILTADCAPVVLLGPSQAAIVHAGWRGIVAGAVERGLEEIGEVTTAWVGPSIHACCYEVGPEVARAFEARDLPVSAGSRVDPGGAAAAILRRSGVRRVEMSIACTSCDSRYFSWRRDGVTGRQGAFVTLVEP